MLCRGAKRDWLVFGEFDPRLHVGEVSYCRDWALYRAIDFGYAAPLVCLWIQLTPAGAVHVLDEYVQARKAIPCHAAAILQRDPPGATVAMTYVDPAGRNKESTSGEACTGMLESAGIRCSCRTSTIAEGLELIRAALAPAAGQPLLRISPRCRQLIAAFQNYHYPPFAPEATDAAVASPAARPVKDGPDHFLDALRYFFVNRMRPRMETRRKNY
jgi:hypothetical protein